MPKSAPTLTIGRIELVALPALGSLRLDAKIDTGAYTSAMHCKHVTTFMHADQKWVRFDVPITNCKKTIYQTFELPVHKLKRIRSSNGLVQDRFIVKTTLRIGPYQFKTEFSLTDRSRMQFPVLLGRKALKSRFLVDVAQKYLLTTDAPASL